MKTTKQRILFAALMTAAFTLNTPAQAQFRPETDDGVAASPKMRQQLNEHNAHKTTATDLAVAAPSVRDESKAVASPKGAQQLAESGAAMKRGATNADTASTTAPAKDGVVAPPKHRAQLNERGTQVQIAPVK